MPCRDHYQPPIQIGWAAFFYPYPIKDFPFTHSRHAGPVQGNVSYSVAVDTGCRTVRIRYVHKRNHEAVCRHVQSPPQRQLMILIFPSVLYHYYRCNELYLTFVSGILLSFLDLQRLFPLSSCLHSVASIQNDILVDRTLFSAFLSIPIQNFMDTATWFLYLFRS